MALPAPAYSNKTLSVYRVKKINTKMPKKPAWLRVRLPSSKNFSEVNKNLEMLRLNTVCRSAACPNMFECFSRKVATFLILGNVCTRNCSFCNVAAGIPSPPDNDEPGRISEAVAILKLKHVVITSVTRDDLDDKGAGHFAEVLNRLRKDHPGASLEVLTPDFGGDRQAVDTVLEAKPDVYGHNLETVRRLYPLVRPGADYDISLGILDYVQTSSPALKVKTGIMAGLGEDDMELVDTLGDVADSGCHAVTVGQYLRPSLNNLEVRRYVRPEGFEYLAQAGKGLGLQMFCGPLVRSSYHADRFSSPGVSHGET